MGNAEVLLTQRRDQPSHWHPLCLRQPVSIVIHVCLWLCLLAGYQVTAGLPGCDGVGGKELISPGVTRVRNWV